MQFTQFTHWYLERLMLGECHRTPLMIDNIGSGNGLMPSGNKPLPEPVLSQIYVASLGHNELSNSLLSFDYYRCGASQFVSSCGRPDRSPWLPVSLCGDSAALSCFLYITWTGHRGIGWYHESFGEGKTIALKRKMSSVRWLSLCPLAEKWIQYSLLTLLMLETECSSFGGQYHACWCPGSLSCQSISRHGIGCVGQTTCIVVPVLISSTWIKPNPRYDSDCEYIFRNLKQISMLLPHNQYYFIDNYGNVVVTSIECHSTVRTSERVCCHLNPCGPEFF